MPYRRTENVARRLAAREQAILDAATALAAEGGLAAVQIAAVAARAGIAAGTVYRYFPAKTDLVGAVVAAVEARELEAMRAAAARAPGPLSALAATIAAFAARALAAPTLMRAITAEPVEPELDPMRRKARHALAREIENRVAAAIAARLLPEIDASLAASAVLGVLLEGLLGPPAPAGAVAAREAAQTATLMALRALGVVDARARGLIAQCALPGQFLPFVAAAAATRGHDHAA
jgi:AcrR family transcriptional regulator